MERGRFHELNVARAVAADQPGVVAKVPALDGLRGLAALAVLISHSANAGFAPAILGDGFGRVGVVVFYALSGFLIAHVTFGAPFRKSEIARYLVARGARVLPLYFAILVVSSLLLGLGIQLYKMSPDALPAAWTMMHAPSVLWSIPVELHFYVVFLAVWCAGTKGWFVPAVAALTLMQAALLTFAPLPLQSLPYWFHFFALGVVVRWLWTEWGGLRDPGRWSWLILAAAILLPPQVRASIGWSTPELWSDPFSVVVIPLVLWCCITDAPAFRWLRHPLLAWLGGISYSLYLLHRPLIDLVAASGLPPVVGFAVIVATSVGAAAASRRWIEGPAQRALRGGVLPPRSSGLHRA